ncbi:MAG TPA: tetratricopeptide repeat protein [Gemmatimonadaceae bacterium]|nr:tetratricopeptide repeat protein [Gemmatimonadaceae bacterium]
MIALKLLGGLTLESDVAPLPPSALQRRRLALLALLALSGKRGLARERVEAYLWPESTPDRARHALDQLLYATRRDLGGDAILSSAGELRINPAVVRPDSWAFDEAIRAQRWSEAAELYTGALLSGLHLADDSAEFGQWLDAERMRVDQDYHRALEALARAAAARGDHAEAVRWWRRRAGADPLSVSAALGLMHALVAAGDRTGAIRHARIYQQLVRTTLDLEPDASVGVLASALELADANSAKPAPAPGPSPVASLAQVASETEARSLSESEAGAPAATAPRVQQLPRGLRVRATAAGILVAGLAVVAAMLVVPDRSRTASPATLAPQPSPVSGDSSAAQPVGGASSASHRTADPQARILYLRARASWNQRTKRGLQDAVVLYRRATERDPEYADAYAGLAEAYAMLGYFGFEPPDAMFPKARAAANRALELDPSVGEAYAPLGQVLAWKHAWAESERAYQRGLALAPENATLHQWYGLMLAYMGRAHEAAVQAGAASRLDPLSVQINNMYGMMLYYDGDLAGALHQYERTVEEEPDSAWVRRNPWVLSNFSRIAAASGRHAQAMRLLHRALQVVPHDPRVLLEMANADVMAGEPEQARAAFARADTMHPQYRIYRAKLDALLGDLDEAFAILDSADEYPLPALVGLNNDPAYAALRADPRYQIVRKRLNMPPLR